MIETYELIATCAFGLEAVVARELKQLGYEAKPGETGRVHFLGGPEAIVRANLWLRCADRVLIRLGCFEATDFGQLFEGTRDLPWERWIDPQGSFPVRGRSVKSQLSSVPACQRIVKKAVAERLASAHRAEQLPETGETYGVEVALLKDRATLTLDTTGPSLHKRGYRRLTGSAQLKETLAAALLLLSFWEPERPLLDPFCGTGTIPIEAALLGRNIAPGLQRTFASEAWAVFDPAHWQRARDAAREQIKRDLPGRIIGQDVDGEALKLARHHAEAAGVPADIHFQQRDFFEVSSPRKHGCTVTNPPYGHRLGASGDTTRIHEAIPLVLRKLPTWSHFILTAYPRFEELIGQQADRRRKLYNGRIECTYYQFHGPKPPKLQGARNTKASDSASNEHGEQPAPSQQVFGGVTEKMREQAELFRRRLAKRARHFRRWPTRRGITCYRVYDRDIPEIPLAVDRYEDALHIAEYERPHERTPGEHADWLDLMVRIAGETLGVAGDDVFLKKRSRQRGAEQYHKQGRSGREMQVQEGGLTFVVNLSDYLDTGLFLDHRVTRGMVREAAAGTRFLNLFGYTGSFTVYAAAGGAKETVTVDTSRTYLDWAERNLQINHLAGAEHQFVLADAREFLESLPARPLFDLAVVDPPTYSNSKDRPEDWDVQRDHAALLNELARRMPPAGVVFFSTNYRRFKLDEAALPPLAVHEISRQTVPEDFRNRRIHRCWRLARKG